jgi:hypothetical protein
MAIQPYRQVIKSAIAVNQDWQQKMKVREGKVALSEGVPYPKVYPLGQGHNISLKKIYSRNLTKV